MLIFITGKLSDKLTEIQADRGWSKSLLLKRQVCVRQKMCKCAVSFFYLRNEVRMCQGGNRWYLKACLQEVKNVELVVKNVLQGAEHDLKHITLQ